MKRSTRILFTSAVIGCAALVLVGLSWPGYALAQGTPPPIPHSTEGREECLACHQDGVAGAPQVPEDHAGRTNDICQACHTPASPPPIPHDLEGREVCTDCHLPGTPEAEATPEVEQPLFGPTPVFHAPLEGETDNCVACHAGLESSAQIVVDWQISIHAERGVICADCHGGDPNSVQPAVAMSEAANFVGTPDRADIPELCGSCHANVNLMRQYDLPTDQLAKYRESFHGQQLAAGDTNVATCFDCHDGHATRETNDPQASVYHLNVPELCASCHADEEYMAGYDIPTNQFALYQDSVHGIALLEHQDTRAPSCATCHGTHGAAPPGFTEVSNVCGSCHAATQDYFLEGAHGSDNAEAPRCVTCHGRYDVSQPTEDLFVGSEDRHCGSCHTPDSPVGESVAALYDSLVAADTAYKEAEDAVSRARQLGMLMAEEENMLADARTKLITARAAQHTVDLETVQAETEASLQISQQVHQQAEDAIGESRFRRQAMIIAVVAIGLVIASLVLLRRELTAVRQE